jgi:hypothetical protein
MKPVLMSVTAVYVQDTDGTDLGLDDQTLTLEMTSCGAAPFLVISTQRWSVDRPKDLNRLVRQFAAQVEYLFDADQGV